MLFRIFITACCCLFVLESCKKDPFIGNDVELRHAYILNACAGRCTREVIVRNGQVTYIESSFDTGRFDSIIITRTLSHSAWEDLLRHVPYNAFSRLPDTIGCPTCNDRIGERIGITRGEYNKDVAIELALAPSSLNPLLDRLRELNFSFP